MARGEASLKSLCRPILGFQRAFLHASCVPTFARCGWQLPSGWMHRISDVEPTFLALRRKLLSYRISRAMEHGPCSLKPWSDDENGMDCYEGAAVTPTSIHACLPACLSICLPYPPSTHAIYVTDSSPASDAMNERLLRSPLLNFPLSL